MRLIDADALLHHQIEADRMGAMLVVGIGRIFSAPTVSPWVKTSDRLPTEADGEVVLTAWWDAVRKEWCRWTAYACYVEGDSDYWMPIPPLPGAIGPDAGEMAPNGDEGARE